MKKICEIEKKIATAASLEKQASLGMGIMELRRIAGDWRNKRMGIIAYIWVLHKRSGTSKSPKTCSQFHAIKLVAEIFSIIDFRAADSCHAP
jgi:hypothetical protein